MIEIPVDPGREYSYTESISLSGVDCELRIVGNVRAGHWSLSISVDGEAIILSRPIVLGVDLLARATHPSRPPGSLYCVAMRPGLDTPGRFDLGTAARLFYLEPGEVAL